MALVLKSARGERGRHAGARRTPTKRAEKPRATLYAEVTDRIIAEREAGRLLWIQPWSNAAASAPNREPFCKHWGARGRRTVS